MVQQLHIFFFPMLAHGHMLPTLDMAKVFVSRGIKATMITTHYHVPMFEKAIQRSKELGFDISVRALKFPSSDSGLPEGIESLDQLKSDDLIPAFIMATTKLQAQLEQLLEDCRPNCIVADMFFPWATEAAAKFGIPRLVFGGTSTFALCVGESLRRNRPFDHVSCDTEPFLVPEIPHQIQMTRAKIAIHDSVGAKEWSRVTKNVIKGEDIAKAVERIMVGEEAIQIRVRSKVLKVAAKKSVEEGGSSYSSFNALIQDLSAYQSTTN
ncbi:OLC1v1003336C1 [Oldenlandia corymbosa var. corymbosa]|uniref:OLC1v1003336C1 n=1 Tax=Oldenlandia corymbosa var. corymbosa TaxID=529605 RepID=A0AAV1D9U0_OLDCO|nr:OLC1v1003336C1 [Oldenlandia corymbosa var. corymbosa]